MPPQANGRYEHLAERQDDLDDRLDTLAERISDLTLQSALLSQKLDLHAAASKDASDRIQVRLDVLSQAIQARSRPLTAKQVVAWGGAFATVVAALSAAIAQVVEVFK